MSVVIGKYTFSIAWHAKSEKWTTFKTYVGVSNEGVEWMFPRFQEIKGTSVAFSINKMIQGCVGMVDEFKMSDVIGISINHSSADDMVLNPTLDVLSAITRGGSNFWGENRILLYLNVFKNLYM